MADAQGAAPGEPGSAATEDQQRSRRSKEREEVSLPTGYRSSRRGSKAQKHARKAMREQRILRVWDKTRKTTTNLLWLAGIVLGGLAAAALVLWAVAFGINSLARWNAKRMASRSATDERSEKAKENLLVIGVKDGKPAGFLAMRYDQAQKQVYGVAIPEGAFLEVPGQGFERVGDSLAAGPDVAADAVSNYLSVPFERYAVVPGDAYQQAVKDQSVASLLANVPATNLSPEDLVGLRDALGKVPTKNVALVPLPVKPIKLGSQTYFEPQRDEIADLLKTWWGVDVSKASQVPRVVVYNGAGTPGIAGKAAQKLIRSGYRVVDTKNADRFTYKTTQIVVQNGDDTLGTKIKDLLGGGKVIMQPADQDVADAIVIIGRDFKP